MACRRQPAGAQALCRQRLSSYKLPTTIRVLETLPQNAVGKLDKRALLNAMPG